jgi:hypothetical protein
MAEQIHNVRAKVLPQALEPLRLVRSVYLNSEVLQQVDVFLFGVCHGDDGASFLLRPSEREMISSSGDIAVFNREAGNILSDIEGLCQFEAYSSSKSWTPILNQTAPVEKNAFILIDIVLYGENEHCVEVGKRLAKKKVYLQEPDYWKSGFGYDNPHFLNLSGPHLTVSTTTNLSQLSNLQLDFSFQNDLPQNTTRTFLKQKIATAFKNMTRAKNLKRITACVRICTPLLW